jgi:hypothetical protein
VPVSKHLLPSKYLSAKLADFALVELLRITPKDQPNIGDVLRQNTTIGPGAIVIWIKDVNTTHTSKSCPCANVYDNEVNVQQHHNT